MSESAYKEGRRGRRLPKRKPRISFLIVCEGACTEPNYFKGFRLPAKVADIRGIGANTVSLVNKTIALRNQGDYDSVWCVFDRDSFLAPKLQCSLTIGRSKRYQRRLLESSVRDMVFASLPLPQRGSASHPIRREVRDRN